MVNHYLPVKILKQNYADQLMAGKVFMRQMKEFGCWNGVGSENHKSDQTLQEGMRSDFHEGTCYVAQKGEHDPYGFVNGLPDDMKSVLLNVAMIDDRQQYTKIFCMTKMDYNKEDKAFYSMSSRLAELGATAVIIYDPRAFYQRLQEAFAHRYSNLYMLSSDAVTYRNLFGESREWDVFTKADPYGWQNEVRIAAKLRDDICIQNPDEMMNDPIIEIGDISDIAVEASMSDLLEGKYPAVLFSEAVQRTLQMEHGLPDGLTEFKAVIVEKFRGIEPSHEWVSDAGIFIVDAPLVCNNMAYYVQNELPVRPRNFRPIIVIG